MPAISITATGVIPSARATLVRGVAGATITQGQTLYKDTADGNKYKLCDANGSAATAALAGIAACGASAGQPILVITEDPELNIGATLAIGDTLWTSATPGGITITAADNVTGVFVTSLGQAISTTSFNFKPVASGAAKA